DKLPPAADIFPWLAGIRSDTGIVHKDRDIAKRLIGGVAKQLYLFKHRDIHRNRFHRCRTTWSYGRHRLVGALECRPRKIGKYDLHLLARKSPGGSETDAAGSAGDDCGAAWRYGRMYLSGIADCHPNAPGKCYRRNLAMMALAAKRA